MLKVLAMVCWEPHPKSKKKKFLLSFDSTFTCNMVIYLSKLIKDGMIPSSKQ